MRRLHPLLAVLAFAAACGPDRSDPQPPAPVVRWIGADPRPLAVGSAETLSFELVSGEACCDGGYAVQSSAPSVLTAEELGGQVVQVTALTAGSAQLSVSAAGGQLGSLPITTALPAAIAFEDPSRAAAAIPGEPALPARFSLLSSGQAEIDAVISDATGDPLFSQRLAVGAGSGAVDVEKVEPERFLLTALPTPGGGQLNGQFAGALAGDPESALTYPVEVAGGAASASLLVRKAPDGSAIVLARALALDGTELLGLPAWTFGIAGLATVIPLEDAAATVLFAPGTAEKSVELTATNPVGLSAQLALP